MAWNGDFKAGVGSAATFQEKCSNPRGCNAEHNLPLRAKMVAKGVVDVCLACAARTMKEKGLSCLVEDSRTDPFKSCLLSRIKSGNVLLCIICLLLCVIVQLLSEEWIPCPACPVPNNLWHAVPVPKLPPRGSKELINEVKPIIANVLL